MCSLLRTTRLSHVQFGNDVAEHTLLGLLAITGVLEERLIRLEAPIQSTPPPHHDLTTSSTPAGHGNADGST
ncbi:hypothetical protein [Rhodococcus sp. NPDC055024]